MPPSAEQKHVTAIVSRLRFLSSQEHLSGFQQRECAALEFVLGILDDEYPGSVEGAEHFLDVRDARHAARKRNEASW